LFLLQYIFKTNSSGHNKTWGAQQNLGAQKNSWTLPLNAPMATGLAQSKSYN